MYDKHKYIRNGNYTYKCLSDTYNFSQNTIIQ